MPSKRGESAAFFRHGFRIAEAVYHKTDFQEETRATARAAPTDGDAKDLIRRSRFQYSRRVNPHRNGERLCGSRQRSCSSRALLCGSLWFPAAIVWFPGAFVQVPGRGCVVPGASLCSSRRVVVQFPRRGCAVPQARVCSPRRRCTVPGADIYLSDARRPQRKMNKRLSENRIV